MLFQVDGELRYTKYEFAIAWSTMDNAWNYPNWEISKDKMSIKFWFRCKFGRKCNRNKDNNEYNPETEDGQ